MRSYHNKEKTTKAVSTMPDISPGSRRKWLIELNLNLQRGVVEVDTI